jgi:hypothetical protein
MGTVDPTGTPVACRQASHGAKGSTMADSLLDQLKARGEVFVTEISNNLLSNPTFIEMLKKGLAAKEAVDKQVGEALRNVNVATRRDLAKLDARLSDLEAEIGTLRSARTGVRPRAASSRTSTSSPSRKKAARRK